MIKHINHQNFLTTPFVTVKSWELLGFQNEQVVLTEPLSGSSSIPPYSIALDYIDENFGDPILDRECNIALEQQEPDIVLYDEGISGSSDTNADGSDKGLLHRQIKNAFYNEYRNPLEIFGVEHIDFPLSRTVRNLAEQFRMFSIPRMIFGEKLVPNSIYFADTALDDNVIVHDDGYQNIMAGYNLFSKVQEVRIFPSGTNPQIILPGTESCGCVTYGTLYLTNPLDQYVDLGNTATFTVSSSGAPRPIMYQWWSGSTTGSGWALSDGGNISGSNGPSLYVNNTTLDLQSGSYYVKAWNSGGGGATSSIAHLYIYLLPPNITDPADDFEEIGSNFDFCAGLISGASPLYWQWYSGSTLLVDDAHYSGSNTSCLRVNNITPADSGSYRVMVGNIFGNVTSSWANGNVNLYPALIVNDPQDQIVYRSFSASFAVTASGTMPLMYQWYSGSVPLTDNARITGSQWTGSTTSSLFINDVDFPDSGLYHVVVNNFFSNATSADALLTVLDNVVPVSASDTSSFGVQLRFGSLTAAPPYVEPTVPSFGASLLTGSVFLLVIPAYGGNDTASLNTAFDSGYLFDIVIPLYGGNETASLFTTFESGYITDAVVPLYGGNETASVFMTFENGYTQSVVIPTSSIEPMTYFGVGFLSGSIA